MIDFYFARSLVYQKQMQPNSSVQFTKKPSPQLIQITDIINKFLPTLISYNPGTITKDQAEIDQIFKKFVELIAQSEVSFIYQTIAIYLALASNNYEYICGVDPKKFAKNQQEIIYLQMVNYLQAFRNDLAEQKFKQLQQLDDEDVLTLLAQVQFNVSPPRAPLPQGNFHATHLQTLSATPPPLALGKAK